MANNKNVKANLRPFPKGKSGNPKGRPRKLISSMLIEMKAQGIEAVKPSQIADTYEMLFNLTIEEVKEKAMDEKCPIFVRIIAKAMLSGKGTEMIEKMLDRAHGKAKQSMDLDVAVYDNTLQITRRVITKTDGQ